SVREYGADGNGSNDDTVAIQNAINSMHAGETLYFPCTNGQSYKVTNTINFGSMADKTIKGSGRNCAIDYEGSAAGRAAAFNFVGAIRSNFSDIKFYAGSSNAPETVVMFGRVTNT